MRGQLKECLKQMIKTLSNMVDQAYQGLMENDVHHLNSALNKERIIDDLEKEITSHIVHSTRSLNEGQRKKLILLGQVSENIERMGDELRYLIERIEIKIAEKLFFSELGVEQYKEVFNKMNDSVKMVAKFLEEEKEGVLKDILKNGEQIQKLVEKYRAQHVERLAKGICDPRAANMYFDMLDFTGNVARHCTNIARIHKPL